MRIIGCIATALIFSIFAASANDGGWRLAVVKKLPLMDSAVRHAYFSGDKLILSVKRTRRGWLVAHNNICQSLSDIGRPSGLDIDVVYFEGRSPERFAEMTCAATAVANADVPGEDAENLGAVGADGIVRSDAEHEAYEASKAGKPHSPRR